MKSMHFKQRLLIASIATALATSAGTTIAAVYDSTANGQAGAPTYTHNSGGNEIVLQGFHWFTGSDSRRETLSSNKWYAKLKTAADTPSSDLRGLGVTSIWMNPPWYDAAWWTNGLTGDATRDAGGSGYMWQSFNKNTGYGTDQQLKDAAASLKASGIKVIYDIVANHSDDAANGGNNVLFGRRASGNYNWAWCVDQYSINNAPTSANAACDNGGYFLSGAADLNQNNAFTWNTFKNEHVNLATNYSADGFRYDVATGFNGGTVKGWFNQTLGANGMCIGEYWDGSMSKLSNWAADGECTVFDFTLKYQLQTGNIYNVRYGMNASADPATRARATTFIDNHDTGWSPAGKNNDASPNTYWGQRMVEIPASIKSQAYAYILLSPGTPSIYLPDVLSNTLTATGLYTQVKNLIAVRKDANILADSGIVFDRNQAGAVGHVWGSNKRVVFAIGNTSFNNPKSFTSADCSDCSTKSWTLAASDTAAGYKVWVEGTAPVSPNCGPGGNTYVCNYTSMYIRGTSNAWGGDAMVAVGNNTWEGTTTFTGTGTSDSTRDRFKFNPSTANWTTNWGNPTSTGATDCTTTTCTASLGASRDVDACGSFACSGKYTVQFNDATLKYSIKATSVGYIDTSNKRPIANLSAPVNTSIGEAGKTVRAGTALTFTSSATDPNGNALTYNWICTGVCTGFTSDAANTFSSTSTKTWTPSATSGTSVMTMTVSDGQADQSATAAITSASTTIVLSAANNYIGAGHTVSGTGIPSGTTVSTLSSDGKTITLSAAATATNSAASLTFSSKYAAKTVTLIHQPTYASSYAAGKVETSVDGTTWVAAGPMRLTADNTWTLGGVGISGTALSFRVTMDTTVMSSQTVTAAGTYTITYNDSTSGYTKTLTAGANTCDATAMSGATRAYKRVDIRGQFNGGSSWSIDATTPEASSKTKMILVGNNIWRKTVVVPSGTQQFKFDACGAGTGTNADYAGCTPNWAINFGTAFLPSVQGGTNLNWPNGSSVTYCVEFNDSTKKVTATKL